MVERRPTPRRPEDELLGGARRSQTRPRGFAPWQPQAPTLALLDTVRAVLDEYRAHLPLTVRQIFYRLVGAHRYEKSENAYTRLAEILNRARRARLLDMDDIRDGGGAHSRPSAYASADHFVQSVRWRVERLHLDRLAGQRARLAVTREQISTLRLPTAPAKASDRRAFAGATCQAEAIAPDELADIVRNAIESRIDHAAYQKVLKREVRVRRELIRRLAT